MNLIHNETANRFEFIIDEQSAYISYQIKGNNIYLISTHVPENLGGKGIGSKLVKSTLQHIETMKLKIVPICSFIQKYFDRHPERKDLLA